MNLDATAQWIERRTQGEGVHNLGLVMVTWWWNRILSNQSYPLKMSTVVTTLLSKLWPLIFLKGINIVRKNTAQALYLNGIVFQRPMKNIE